METVCTKKNIRVSVAGFESFYPDLSSFLSFFSKKNTLFEFSESHAMQGNSPCFIYCTSTGKEKDVETGFGYFGARYMDHELMTMWLSVDPMAYKYPSISPYAYCAWNPVKLVDPEGRKVYVFGDEANRIVEQLQTGLMEVVRAENGLLSVNLHGKTRDDLSSEERQIYDAITSTDVTIYVSATKSAEVDGKHYFVVNDNGEVRWSDCLFGGSNLGTKLNNAKNKANSYCFIDMDLMTKKGFDQGVAHEVSECYQAGLLAIKNQQNIDPAIQNVTNPLMMQAHNSAVPERVSSGGMYQFGVPYGSIGKVKPLEFKIK